jgi:putative transcriptional regulator
MKVRIKLAEILEKRGISGREFARQTGIRHPTIHEMCRNESKSLPVENIAKICEVLGIGIDQLIELDKETADEV